MYFICSIPRNEMGSLVWDSGVIIFSEMIFFAAGWLFFVKAVFRNYEIHLRSVQVYYICIVMVYHCLIIDSLLDHLCLVLHDVRIDYFRDLGSSRSEVSRSMPHI
jgi:hypothetical protein